MQDSVAEVLEEIAVDVAVERRKLLKLRDNIEASRREAEITLPLFREPKGPVS